MTQAPATMPELLPCAYWARYSDGSGKIFTDKEHAENYAENAFSKCEVIPLYTRATPEAVQNAGLEIERLQGVLERDRTKVIEAYNALKKIIGGVSWIAESRGPYEYDDAEYQKEFGRALKAIENSIVPLFEIGRNLKDCPPTFAKAVEARMVKDETTLAKTKTPVPEVVGLECRIVAFEGEIGAKTNRMTLEVPASHPICLGETVSLYAQGHRAAPDGWQLVPIEPNTEILQAIHEATPEIPSGHKKIQQCRDIYTTSLSAAPVKGDE